jgi:hypothetical protein
MLKSVVVFMSKSAMTSMSVLLFACAAATAEKNALQNRDLRKVYMPDANQHRIKVPIHTRLLDAMKSADHPRHRGKRRHYEIETMDESSSVSTLHLEEVDIMAITPQTTYNFKRELDASAVDFAILAHHTNEHMTILSVDRPTGRVRGLHREMHGKTRHITNENGDKMHMRSLQEVNNRREWTCDALSHDHDKKRAANFDSNSTWDDRKYYTTVDSTDLRKRVPRNDGKREDEPNVKCFILPI